MRITATTKNVVKFAAMASVLLLFACDKNPFDYRTKYIGDYVFEVHSTLAYDSAYHDTTYTAEGKIDYGASKHFIAIFLHADSETGKEFRLHEDGSLGDGSNGYGCSGSFSSTDILSYSCDHSTPASHNTTEVIGSRK